MRAGRTNAPREGLLRGVITRPEVVLAILAVVVGAVGVLSALIPGLIGRVDVSGILPPGLPTAGRVAAIAFGLGLVWLSRGLAARKRRAWQLALGVLVGIALAHLAKGLDFEEALLSLLLLALLLATRRRFDAPGDPLALLPLGLAMVSLGVVTAPLIAVAGGAITLPERATESLWALAMVLSTLALQIWLRPWRERKESATERAVAREIVATSGSDSLDFFALRGDKRYFFSADRNAFVAYRVVIGCALIAGDPVGNGDEFGELLTSFREFARTRGWRIGLLAGSDAQRPLYNSLGLRALKLGDEAIVRATGFSLEGRHLRKIRQSVSRLEREGYHLRIVREEDIPFQLRAELEHVSTKWRGKSAERGFAMAMDQLFGHPETVFAIATDADGQVGGFLHLVPSANQRGYSLSAMRRRPSTPNGLMEYLIASTLGWMDENNLDELSLNFCAFADILRSNQTGGIARRLLRLAMLELDRAFQLNRLLRFNSKFLPVWRPRYLLVERLTDLPRVGFACVLAESLLPQPTRISRARLPVGPRSA
jgi:lysyl-tRNA synthetase class 2